MDDYGAGVALVDEEGKTGVWPVRPHDLSNAQANDHRDSRVNSHPRVHGAHEAWQKVPRGLVDPDVEGVLDGLSGVIAQDARKLGIDERSVRTQIRLHLPGIERSTLRSRRPKSIYEMIRLQVIARCSRMRENADHGERLAYTSLLIGAHTLRRDLTVERHDAPPVQLAFGSVQPSYGYFIQSRLHYLMSARCDTTLELGIHVPEARMPWGYVGFSACDRGYLREAIARVDPEVDPSQVLVLTRMYGLPSALPNLMSLVIARSAQYLRHSTSARYIVTAFNPMLGFSGAVYRASGFVPFGMAPVTYGYDDQGFFSSRRSLGKGLTQSLDTPPNVLLILGVDRHANRRLARVEKLVSISRQQYLEKAAPAAGVVVGVKNKISRQMRDNRRFLESAWSVDTVHPGYIKEFAAAPGPQGQCGIASVWLARELRVRYGIEATYCYGNLETDVPGVKPVDHHCWLEIGAPADPRRLVVDLTCDQAIGLGEATLCEWHGDLERRGLRYVSFTRRRLDELDQDRVWSRYLSLRDTLEAIGRELPQDRAVTLV
jgi:hypothetical protein